MRVTFLTPGYAWGPSGGYRVIYEYANRLVSRGHQVNVVHPRRAKYSPPRGHLTVYARLRAGAWNLIELFRKPKIDWHSVDTRVNLLYVPSSEPRYIPDGDAIFGTAWDTARAVLQCPETKGEKFYLIQGYETWRGPKDLLDATWQLPLHKVVIAKWLLELGKELCCQDMVYIPNAVDHGRYKLKRPIGGRPRHVAMSFSSVPIKGSTDGIKALEIARKKYPDLKAVLFGAGRGGDWIPAWMHYYRNPPQAFIVDEIYNNSSIFLSPSWSEGFDLPAAEASACGCAIVATDIGGHQEYIQNGVTGLLSPVKNPLSLAENMCVLLGDEELRATLAKACNRVVSQFSWERSADLLEGFIKGALERNASSPIAGTGGK